MRASASERVPRQLVQLLVFHVCYGDPADSPILLLVSLPGLLYSPRRFWIINVEANHRGDHRPNAYVGWFALTDMATVRASKLWRTDLTFGADLLEYSCPDGHVDGSSLRTACLDATASAMFRPSLEPDVLKITGRHCVRIQCRARVAGVEKHHLPEIDGGRSLDGSHARCSVLIRRLFPGGGRPATDSYAAQQQGGSSPGSIWP